MPRKKPAPPRREVIACTAAQLPAIQAIYNDAILNTTALYEYAPRTDAMMRDWFADRERAGIPILGIEWEPGVIRPREVSRG
jgi:phosphinothricin acetyltransferase